VASKPSGIVSFSIFGSNPRYTVGAIRQLRLYNSYSDVGPVRWDCRFYVGKSTPRWDVDALVSEGGLVTRMDDYPEDQTSTFWRFNVFSTYPDYAYYLIRDTDSRLCPREIAATNQWIESGKDFHLMRDHPYHNVPVLAGLWGATGNAADLCSQVLPAVPHEDFYLEVNRYVNHAAYQSNDFYQVDQWWLRTRLHRRMRPSVWVHDSMFKLYDRRRDIHQFPTPRGRGEFVGKGWEADDTERYPEHSLLV
jgi:hypothetical protein